MLWSFFDCVALQEIEKKIKKKYLEMQSVSQ